MKLFPSRPSEWGERQFEFAVARYSPRLSNALRALGCHDTAVVDEVVVETWSRVRRSCECVPCQRAFETWIFTIAAKAWWRRERGC